MDELKQLQRLAGIADSPKPTTDGSNISATASELRRIEREQNIRPGTKEWFQLWFRRPYLTGEMVPGFRGRKR
jgi:hypothetical protein